MSMLPELGASISICNSVTSFVHPLNTNQLIHILLDVCHMLKLVRNTLGDNGSLLDSESNEIQWKYIVELQALQEKERLRLGNKLKAAHINWWQQKMKVILAAQPVSSSAANAIEHCADVLNLE